MDEFLGSKGRKELLSFVLNCLVVLMMLVRLILTSDGTKEDFIVKYKLNEEMHSRV